MSEDKIKLFIIVLNFNGKDLVLDCLNSLRVVETGRDFELSTLVVDNNSSDGSLGSVRKLFPQVVLIRNKKNLGWAGGNNIGIGYAEKNGADCVLLLNNDVVVEKDFLKKLLTILYSNSEIGIVGPKSYFPEKNKIIADAGGMIKKNRFFGVNRGNGEKDKGQYDKIMPVDFISGSAMMIKNEVFKKIGLLDERYFLYYEDADFCFRARQAGFLSVFVPQSVVFHKVGATSKIGSALHNYYTTRNHYLFVDMHAPLIVRLKEFFRTPKTLLEFARSLDQKRRKYSILGVRDYFFRRFGERNYW